MTAPMNGLVDIKSHRDALDLALTRFYVAKGSADVDISSELLVPSDMTAADRKAHAGPQAASLICDRDIVEFMLHVSGMSQTDCATSHPFDNTALCDGRAQPDWVPDGCYAEALEIVQGGRV